MTPSKVSRKVISDRLEWVDRMVAEIRVLPLERYEEFTGESKNIWAADSCLRRALEALLDIGRHILAKSFGVGVSEYKQIAQELGERRVLSGEKAILLRTLAGYRNRLVHFYHEISTQELYDICAGELDDVLIVREAFAEWVRIHPDEVDEAL